jgi:hypothetical protein
MMGRQGGSRRIKEDEGGVKEGSRRGRRVKEDQKGSRRVGKEEGAVLTTPSEGLVVLEAAVPTGFVVFLFVGIGLYYYRLRAARRIDRT